MNYRAIPVDMPTPSPGLVVREHAELFPTGKWTITAAAISLLAQHHIDPAGIIWRHRTGDWGDVDLDQAMVNNDAVLFGGPIRSSYPVGTEFVHIATITGGTITSIYMTEDADDE